MTHSALMAQRQPHHWLIDPGSKGEHTAEVFSACGPGWEEAERQLSLQGAPLPLWHRSVWLRAHPNDQNWFVAVRDVSGRCVCGFAVAVTHSRALPGHSLLRVERFGSAVDAAARNAGLAALSALARGQPRILRVYLGVFSREPGVRDQVARTALALGFRGSHAPRGYAQTVVIDVDHDEAELLAGFHGSARRNIREVTKRTLEIRPITDRAFAPRMHALLAETMGRTGGSYRAADWQAILDLSRDHPALSRVVGTFRTDSSCPNALLAFAWACSHGDHVEYRASASTRVPGDRTSLAYALVWDLIRWAHQSGAKWFDFGGVTAGQHGSSDPLGGISDFKRSFSDRVAVVGEEWLLEPHPLRAKVAQVLSQTRGWLGAGRAKWS